ncbi:MAG: flagellar hook-length control protein FliK [Bacilli bacterium]
MGTTFTSEPSAAMGVSTSASKRHANAGHKNHVKLHDRQAGQSAGPLVQGSGIFLSLLAAEKQRTLQPAAKSGFLTPDAGRTAVRRGQGEHTQTQAESAALAGAGRKKEQGSLPGALTAGKQVGKQDRKGVRTALLSTGRRVITETRSSHAAIGGKIQQGQIQQGFARSEAGLAGSGNGSAPVSVTSHVAAPVVNLSAAGSNARSHQFSGSRAAPAAVNGNTANGTANGMANSAANGMASAGNQPVRTPVSPAAASALTAAMRGVVTSVSPGVAAIQSMTAGGSAGREKPVRAVPGGAPQTGHLRLRLPAVHVRAGLRLAGSRGKGTARMQSAVSIGAHHSGATVAANYGAAAHTAEGAPYAGGESALADPFYQSAAHTHGAQELAGRAPGTVNSQAATDPAAPALQSMLMQRFAPEVAGWLMRQSTRVLNSGLASVELTLIPAHLGKLRVTVSGDKTAGLRVRFALANHEAQTLLQSQLPELRQLLQTGGYGAVAFDVGAFTGDSPAKGERNRNQSWNAHTDSGGSAAVVRSESAYIAQRDFDHAGFSARA